MLRFKNRSDAGRKLAARVHMYAGRPNVVVLGLARGGVPVAYEIAGKLKLPLDVLVVRKLGVPGREELAMGAIGPGGVRVLNEKVVRGLDIPSETIDMVAGIERKELERREAAYHDGVPPLQVRDRMVILVDDGLATGTNMRAAVTWLRKQSPIGILVVVPVGAPETCEELGDEVDGIVCLISPDPFFSVGAWYEDFPQTTDQEVRQLLREACGKMGGEGERT